MIQLVDGQGIFHPPGADPAQKAGIDRKQEAHAAEPDDPAGLLSFFDQQQYQQQGSQVINPIRYTLMRVSISLIQP